MDTLTIHRESDGWWVTVSGTCPKCGTSCTLDVGLDKLYIFDNDNRQPGVLHPRLDGHAVTTTCVYEGCEHVFSIAV